MTRNGMYKNCQCHQLHGEPDADNRLKLLSTIPNQRIYRCRTCHSFLAFTEDSGRWEVLMQGDLEAELKNLYQTGAISPTAV